MFKNFYSMVMDDNTNAFNTLPKTTRFQLMVTLAYMWSVMFSLGIGSFFILGTSVILHTLIIAGLFFTADLFRRARKGQTIYEE